MAPFCLVNRRFKNTKSLSGCLPANKSPNTEFDDSEGIGESHHYTWQVQINTGLWSQGEKVD